jgi:hypothetical protein
VAVLKLIITNLNSIMKTQRIQTKKSAYEVVPGEWGNNGRFGDL